MMKIVIVIEGIEEEIIKNKDWIQGRYRKLRIGMRPILNFLFVREDVKR